MLQQVSQLAPSAPPDRGLVAREAPGGAGGAQPGGRDFLAILAQAEAQEGGAPAGEVVPASAAPTGQDEPLQAAGRDGADPSDANVLAGNMTGEASPATDALPDQPSAASSASVIAAQRALNGLPVPSVGLAQPGPGAAQSATGSPAFRPQEEAPPSDLSPAALGLATIGRSAAPAARTALAARVPSDDAVDDKRMAAALAFDLDAHTVGKAVSQDAAEVPEAASALKSEAVAAQPAGPAPTPVVGPSLPEGRGLSVPADPSMAGTAAMSGHPGPGPSSSPVVASLALPYQRLLHPLLSAQVAPAVLAMGLVPGADGGPGRLTVAIRPAELGTLQIITERTEEGTARIAVLAERPETLQLLIRDASTLETALRAAGVDEGSGLSLSFGLVNQGPGDGAGDARRDAGHAPGRGDGADPKPAIIGLVPAMARTSLLDLSL